MRHILIILLAFIALDATAQNLPERGEVRRGNRLFERGEYEMAIEDYNKALTLSPTLFEANYNLSNAQHKAQQFDKAEESMSKLAADSLRSGADRADAYYNLGNSQFHQQKLEEALESYKSSMRLNPADTAAKYNYALTKLLLEAQQQQEQNDENQDDQDQNQDNQDQDQQDQNQDQQDQDGDGEQDQEQPQDQNQEEEQQGEEPQPQDGGMSEQEQQQILDAIQAQEDKTQEKLDEERGRAVIIPGGKNW